MPVHCFSIRKVIESTSISEVSFSRSMPRWTLRRRLLSSLSWKISGEDDEAIAIEAADDLIEADNLGPTFFEAYVPRGNPAPMEEVSRQRRLVTRDLFRNIEALLAIRERRKTFEGDKD
jgi:hypothetical protein